MQTPIHFAMHPIEGPQRSPSRIMISNCKSTADSVEKPRRHLNFVDNTTRSLVVVPIRKVTAFKHFWQSPLQLPI